MSVIWSLTAPVFAFLFNYEINIRPVLHLDCRLRDMTAVPTTTWRWGTAVRRAARCSAASAAMTNQTTSKAAPTSSGWSLCLMDRSTKPGFQPTFLKVRKSFQTQTSQRFKKELFWCGTNSDFSFARDGRVLQTWQWPLRAALSEHSGQLQMCLWPWIWAGSWQTQLWEWVEH